MDNQPFNDFSQLNSNARSFNSGNTPENENGFIQPSASSNGGPSEGQNRFSPGNSTLQKSTNSGSKNFAKSNFARGTTTTKRKVLSVSQILARVNQKKQRKLEQKKRKKPLKPIIPPKSFILLFKDKPEKYVYNRRIIDYKHCGLLQRYIGLGGKILPRRQTRLTAKQQRYIAKTIKSARIMGLLPFVSKEKGFFR